MTRIVHITTVHSREDTRIFLKQIKTLSVNIHYEIHFIVADGRGDDVCDSGKVYIHDLGILGSGRLGRVIFGSWKSFFTIRNIQPVIIHFHDPELILPCILLKLFGYRIVYDVHEDVPLQILDKYWIPSYFRQAVSMIVGVLERFAAYYFDAMVLATSRIAERFPSHKTVVVQNYPILSEFTIPNKIPYKQRTKAFAYIGTIAATRGSMEMVHSFDYLCGIESAKLELAGHFCPASLADDLKKLPAWKSVRYHGQVTRAQVAQILNRVRAGLVLFHPSPNHINAQPNKMYEYMSAGLPVIASDFTLWRQIIEGVGCGLLVDPTRPDAISGAMRWILEHPEEAEAMGQRGQRAIYELYNWDKEATKLIRMYHSLLV